jgi:predicted short-subunit dehydrogenase-like oxidoreductase (DUF2520 family)
MTFPGPEIGLPSLAGVGARVAGTPQALASARAIATALGMVPFEIQGDPTLYHAAAVIAGNHVPALFLSAADVLSRAGVPRADAARLLVPLALEALRRAAESGPDALTGPAARGDVATEDAHRTALSPGEATLYGYMSDTIRGLRRA